MKTLLRIVELSIIFSATILLSDSVSAAQSSVPDSSACSQIESGSDSVQADSSAPKESSEEDSSISFGGIFALLYFFGAIGLSIPFYIQKMEMNTKYFGSDIPPFYATFGMK